MKLFKGLLATFVLACAFNANAALINVTLDVSVISGAGTGATGTAEFEYDDALLTGVGDEVLLGSDYSFSLDLFGQIFTNANDIDFPDYPWLIFEDGVITGMDLLIDENDGINPTDIAQADIFEIFGGEVLQDVLLLQTNDSTSIPEPAAITLFLAGLLAFRRRA